MPPTHTRSPFRSYPRPLASTSLSRAPLPPPMGPRFATWRRALGQRFNLSGVLWFAAVAFRRPHLALPHMSVPDIRHVDWAVLSHAGFRGVVFDKDNTLTAPYSPSVSPPIAGALARCQQAFPGRVAIFSNSAGLYEYDPDGAHASVVEEAIEGVHVIRHAAKKPSGSTEEIEKYFGCPGSVLIMVGDRYFTDVVFGNRNGFLTILTEPLSISTEPYIVQQVDITFSPTWMFSSFESRKINCWLLPFGYFTSHCQNPACDFWGELISREEQCLI